MALTIGTDAYISEADADSYWTDRGNTDWTGLTSAAKEINIRKATDWVDRNFSWIGDKATGPQRLKWPRKYAEVEGFDLSDTEIPWQVEEATAYIADLYRAGVVDLEGIVTDDAAAISMQKVDVITVQYDTSKRLQGADIVSPIYELLRPLTLGANGTLKRA